MLALAGQQQLPSPRPILDPVHGSDQPAVVAAGTPTPASGGVPLGAGHTETPDRRWLHPPVASAGQPPRGLLLGLAVLLVLAGGALTYTHVSPIRYASLWLEPNSLNFVKAGNTNLMGRHQQDSKASPRRIDPGTMLRLQGLCAVLGALATYHLNYDNHGSREAT